MKTKILSAGAGCLLLLSQASLAVTQNSESLSSSNFAMQPPVLTSQETPLVMLGLSVDNQLFYKAYTDYADIDSDGVLDTTYIDTFDYYGYFDSSWCYSYSSSEGSSSEGGAFEPVIEAGGDNGHSCSSGEYWSGNFLNWATMTRMDVLRRVLYGGLRSSDTASSTVLERAYLPSDVHAFAKVYDGSDIGEFTPYTSGELVDGALTMCNVSSSHPYSSSSEPQLRLAKGNYRRWSINESTQCQWDSGANRPATDDRLNKDSEIVLRVKACVAGKDADSENCSLYGSSSKPTGLLQQYGENGDLKFGLISGGYENYISGGRLRKNIGLIGSNETPAEDEVDLDDGTFNDVDGIISSIDAIRIIGWNGSGYDCGGPGISINNFKNKTNRCRDWGNPIAEIYAEAVRYFSGASGATAAYSSGSDTDYINALTEAPWPADFSANPLNANTRCAACSIIMISSGVASFDGDNLASVSDIEGLSSVNDLSTATNTVGQAEYGTFPTDFLVGETTGNDDLLCTSKSVSGLSAALGICPEAPALEGSYQIAGLASHAKTTDLRTDSGMDGDQVVDTYGVELAESVPSFEIPVGSGRVSFLPACQSKDTNSTNWIPCSLFDVEVLATEVDANGELISGTLVFHWEDSSWGSDYDLDGSQVISFCVGNSSSDCDNADNDKRPGASYDDAAVADGSIRISQGVAYTAAGFDLRFGYVVTGSNNDGISDWLLRPGDENRNDLCQLDQEGVDGNPRLPVPTSAGSNSAGCGEVGDNYDYDPQSEIFESGRFSGGRLIDKPLLLAAKYGGFSDKDGSGDPTYQDSSTDTREWDLVNNRTGASGPDGIPDNYFFSSNPGLLVNQLQRIFEALVARTASGTNAAVVANSSSGVGAVYQALYQPQYTVDSNTVTWTGTLRAIFIDEAGRLREDSNGNAKLDGLDVDKVVQLEFDESVEKTFVQRYAPDTSGELVPEGLPVELSELKPIWSAVDRLAEASSAEDQRGSYLSTDLTTRFIMTALDQNTDGEIDQQDVVDFTNSGMSAAYSDYFEYFGLPSDDGIGTLVDFLRGKEAPGLRNRTIDLDGDGVDEVWRLGDIIHSTPAVVATPQDRYNRLYGDTTYEDFVDQYIDRRQVIYVGSNDGMIHAFNGGFWDAAEKEFETTADGKTERPLGQEMWAYVPSNLLPHMRWLAELDYQHVYYMDGEPIVFDANVFPDDDTHPGGWGTIMAMGMRFGGSPIEIEVDSNPVVMRSAYVLFDVTDPEQPPELLGEVTAPDLGFTLSRPVVVKNRAPATNGDWTNPSVNDWYLVLGSGPRGASARSQAVSDQSARLFAIDLERLVDNAGNASSSASSYFTTIGGGDPLDLGGDNGFVGGMEAVDWDQNGSEDAIYIGTVEGSANTPSGRMHRLLIDDNDGAVESYNGVAGAVLGEFVNPGLPIQAAPTSIRDNLGERWLLFGTGKLLVPDDNVLDQQQYFYGVKEPRGTDGDLTYSSVNPNALVDTTDIAVFEESGDVRDISSGAVAALSIDSVEVTSFSGLEDTIRDYPGWKRRLSDTQNLASGRVTNKATLNPANRNSFGFTEYLPPAQSCELDGESFLYALSIQTGTATPDAPLSTSTEYVVNEREMSESVVSLGPGYASSITFHQGSDGTLNAITNMSTGAINTTEQGIATPASGRQSWRQIESISF